MLSLVLSALAAPPSAADASATAPDVLVPADVPGPDASPIINGTPASAGDYPQAGAMIMDLTMDGYGTLRMFVCSSTLIAPDVVMLAAHCVDELAFTYGYTDMTINEIRWTRQADLTDWDGTQRSPGWPDDSVAAADWVKHERFDLYDLQMGLAENYDIALLFLEEPVTDTPFAYVPTEDETDQLEEGTNVTIVGWGQQEPTDGWESPEEGTYAIKYMGEAPVGDIDEYEFQVGPDQDDARKCHGDSGGPTFFRIETESTETLRVVGVTSHAYDSTDCDRTGGADTRVMAYRDWIEEQMVARCEDGTRAWCEQAGLPTPPLPSDEGDDDPDDEDDEDDDEEEIPVACGCESVDATAAPWLLGLLALARRRRA